MNWESFYRNYRKPDYIHGYEIINKLGAGVFGAVFKARKRSIGKFYAVKFLKVEDEKVKEAVLRELETLKFFAQIDHPHLVSIEDKGEVDGIPYIVMGYAGDETLKKRLEERPPTVDETLAIFRQVCEGVQALHEKSIVHFDLKPGNVFLKGGIARVGDYGLSRLMSESRNTLSFGRGTPYYMSPEMLRKKGDKRSDIYSLGIMLYECLAGQVPFRGESEWEVLKKHEVADVEFPKTIREPFRKIIRKCLAKDPEKRYASVRDMVADFPGAVAGFAGAAPSVEADAAGASAGTMPPPSGGPSSFVPPPPIRRPSRRTNPLARAVSPLFATIALVFERMLFGLRQADDAVEGFADPDSKAERAKARREPVAADAIFKRYAQGGIIGNTFRIAGLAIEFSLLVAFVPVKFVFVFLGRLLDFLVNLPFRLLGVALKLVIVVAGFYALFLFVRIILPFSLGILFPFR